MICGDGAAISSSVGDGSNYNEGRKPFLFPAEKKKKDEEEGGEGRGKDRSLRVRSKSSSSATTVSRQEIIELGFPDDGYNYLQHLREIGPSGRTGSFVPNNNLRLDVLRPDVKVFIYCTSCLSILHMLSSHTVSHTHFPTLIFTFRMFSDSGFHIVDYDL